MFVDLEGRRIYNPSGCDTIGLRRVWRRSLAKFYLGRLVGCYSKTPFYHTKNNYHMRLPNPRLPSYKGRILYNNSLISGGAYNGSSGC